MSGVIKSDNIAALSRVRSLASTASAALREDDERSRMRRRVALLEAHVRERDKTIAGLRSDAEGALERGREEGRERGLAEARDRGDERLANLEAALVRAHAEVSARLESLDRLAPLLARDCLDVILGDPEHRAAQLRKLISAQLAKIESDLVLAIEVSAVDFPSDEALAAITKKLGLPAARLHAKPELAPGACAMRLRLGRLEIGLDQQWGTLRDLLAELALPEERS